MPAVLDRPAAQAATQTSTPAVLTPEQQAQFDQGGFLVLRGLFSPAEASATKIYGSELATEVYRSLMEIVGPNAGITGASEGAVLAGRLERFYRSALVMTFGGGTNEIQRDIIGYVGLGLPAAKRS